MKLNIKMNIRQYLTEKDKMHNKSYKNIPKSLPLNNTIRQKICYSKKNTNKKCNYIKIAKMFSNNNTKRTINYNNSTPKNNNVYIDLNDFKNPNRVVEKNSISCKDFFEENKENNENKKVMVKQIPYDIKKYINNQKYPQYDSASFRKAIKYYTLKSDSKTIQVQDLTSYLRPIRNILRIKNIQKIKEPLNKININSINTNNIRENKNKSTNYKRNKNHTQNIYINLLDIEKSNANLIETFNNTHNDTNNSYLKNCYFNKNSLQTDRINKISKFPFNIRIKQENKAIKIFNKNNKNVSDTISFNNNNSKNISDYDTQNSLNNNINRLNRREKIIEENSKTLYQFRPRKIHLPKTGINLSSMQFKNKILQNILNKRKELNKRKF
jgi:hypothetical protein